jgi:hypothetical protein
MPPKPALYHNISARARAAQKEAPGPFLARAPLRDDCSSTPFVIARQTFPFGPAASRALLVRREHHERREG